MEKLDKIKIVTEIPGPKSKELLKRFNDAKCCGLGVNNGVFIKRAAGAMFEDVDGNVFLDCIGGIGVQNIGYSNPEVIQAIKDQADLFTHSMINVVQYEGYVKLCEKLNAITPGSFKKRTALFNSGAEAVDNAVKIARMATGRREVIAYTGAFHGRTGLAVSLTSRVRPYKFNTGPMAPSIHRIPYPYCYRCPYDKERETCGLFCLKAYEDVLIDMVDPSEVAAIVLEAVQGDGGFMAVPKEYMTGLRKICDKYGILLIVDEVQTGFYRTGKLFASNYWDVAPDIICMAKSMAGGVPISAVTARAELMEKLIPGSVGGTYCGNPMACASALKCIEIYERDNYEAKSLHIGELCKKRLEEMKKKYQIIGDIRVLGAMIGVEFVKDRKTKEPAAQACHDILELAFKGGVKIYYCGSLDNVMRFLTPLVVTDEQMNEGLDVIEKAIARVNAETLK